MQIRGIAEQQHRLITNSTLNVAAFAASLVVSFLTIPFVLKRIGLVAFGQAGIALSILAPLQIIGTVLGQAAVKEIAPRIASGDADGVRRFVAAILALCGVVSFAAALLIALSSWLFMGHGAIASHAGFNWTFALVVAGSGLVCQQLALVVQGTVSAAQEYKFVAATSLTTALFAALSVVVCTSLLPTSLGYLAGVSIGYLFAIVAWLVVVGWKLPQLLPVAVVARSDIRSVLGFIKWQGVVQLVGTVGNQMDRYVLGALTSVAAVGQYNIAMRLQEVAYMSVLKSADVLFPYFSATRHLPLRCRADFFVAASWAVNMLAACVLIPLFLVAQPLVTLWVGAAATGSASMLRTLAFAGFLGSAVNVFAYHCVGTGSSARLAALTGGGTAIAATLTIVLIRAFGQQAAGMGVLISSALQQAFIVLSIRRTFAPVLTARSILLSTWSPFLAGGTACLFWLFVGLPHIGNWGALAGVYALIAFSTATMATVVTAASSDGRQLLGRLRSTGRLDVFLGRS